MKSVSNIFSKQKCVSRYGRTHCDFVALVEPYSARSQVR